MSNQRIGTPKFYCDVGLFSRHHGLVDNSSNDMGLFHLNPQKTKTLTLGGVTGHEFANLILNNSNGWLNSLSYVFILGHRFFTDEITLAIYPATIDPNDAYSGHITPRRTVNCDVSSEGFHPITPTNNGWCMVEFDTDGHQDLQKIQVRFAGTTVGVDLPFSFGDISTGWSYIMPHSPDLSLELSYQNESIKTQTTKGGSTLTNSGWSEPPYWGSLPQWMTNDPTTGITDFKGMTPAARRTWSLNFSFLDDTDLLNSHYPGSTGRQKGIMHGFTPLPGATDTSYQFRGIIDTFFSKVVMGTANFKLPFIFQPDSTVDEYAICRINANSFELKQVANNVYNTSVEIVESF